MNSWPSRAVSRTLASNLRLALPQLRMMRNAYSPKFLALTAMLCLTTLGCDTTQHMTDSEQTMVDSETWAEAPFTVMSTGIRGDSIWTVVQYGGGCAEHSFELQSSGPLLKSLPPKQPIRWVHRSPGDPCRAMINDTVWASLLPYRGTPHGITVLLLSGYKGNLLYTYN